MLKLETSSQEATPNLDIMLFFASRKITNGHVQTFQKNGVMQALPVRNGNPDFN
jgi:hypothetical protein